MGKATRIRQQNAREKIAAQRAAAQRAEQRRRLFITGGSVLAVSPSWWPSSSSSR
jgi:hypothetical protein